MNRITPSCVNSPPVQGGGVTQPGTHNFGKLFTLALECSSPRINSCEAIIIWCLQNFLIFEPPPPSSCTDISWFCFFCLLFGDPSPLPSVDVIYMYGPCAKKDFTSGSILVLGFTCLRQHPINPKTDSLTSLMTLALMMSPGVYDGACSCMTSEYRLFPWKVFWESKMTWPHCCKYLSSNCRINWITLAWHNLEWIIFFVTGRRR